MAHYTLHIGYGKTGTTALQRFLTHNRTPLIGLGFIYPDIRLNGNWLYANDHNFLGRSLARREGWGYQSPNSFIQQFEEQRRKAGVEKVILSAETFLGGVKPWDYTVPEDYFEAANRAIKLLRNALEGHDVSIIVYLRRQDHWLESAVNQNIKFAGLLPEKFRNSDPETQAKIYAPRLDYARVLEPWADIFGSRAIEVGVYEHQQLQEGDIILDFASRIGLSMTALERVRVDAESTNQSFSREMLDVKRILNRLPKPKYRERALVEALRHVETEMDQNALSKASIFSPSWRRNLIKSCNVSNAQVAREFLGREDGILFSEPLPVVTGNGEENPNINVELIFEILLRLDQYQRSMRGRERLLRHLAAEKLRKHIPWLHGWARVLRQGVLRKNTQI